MQYYFTDKERKRLATTLTVLHDTREQENSHIIAWLDKHSIQSKQRKLTTGDYSIMLPACPELGLPRDIYFSAAIERKNGVDELVQTIKDRTRFENELIRGQQLEFFALVVEEQDGYSQIVQGDYRSQYNNKALLASLTVLSLRYGCPIHFLPAKLSACWIYTFLYYHALESLKRI